MFVLPRGQRSPARVRHRARVSILFFFALQRAVRRRMHAVAINVKRRAFRLKDPGRVAYFSFQELLGPRSPPWVRTLCLISPSWKLVVGLRVGRRSF